jgi:hypothetical protein
MLSNSVRLVRAVFIAVPTVHQMHFRPYESHINNETLNMLDQVTQGGQYTNVERFSAISGRILSPASQSKGIVAIANGWDTQRYSVLMEFEVVTPMGISREVITGYTGYADMSYGGHLAPDTPIFTNSHTEARVDQVMQHGHRFEKYGSVGARQILSPVTYLGMDHQLHQSEALLRPVDAITYQQREYHGFNQPGVLDTRVANMYGINASARDNVIGGRYLHKVCEGYREGVVNNYDMVESPDYVMGAAADSSKVAEADVCMSSMVFARLRDQTAYTETFYVTVQEIRTAFQEFDHVLQIAHLDTGTPTSMTEHTDHWGAPKVETRIAHMLIQAVPAHLALYLVARYSFNMENQTAPDGSVTVKTLGAQFMVGVADDVRRIQNIEAIIRSTVAASVQAMGVGDYNITMYYNMVGNTTVSVSVNGGMPVDYAAPCYCDALYSPVVGDSTQSLSTIAGDLGNMLNTLYR